MPRLSQQQIDAAREQGYDGGSNGKEEKPLQPLPLEANRPWVYKLVSCTEGPSKSSGRLQWTWELTLDSRYHPEFVNAGYLEKVWHYTPVAPEWAIAKMLHNFGYDPATDTDEIINDEAPILAYLEVDIYEGKPKMKARRFAQHYEDEYPQAKPPILEEAEAHLAAQAAQQAAPQVPQMPQGPTYPASVANPTGHYQVPAEDPWATAAPAPAPVPAGLPPQPPVGEDDTF